MKSESLKSKLLCQKVSALEGENKQLKEILKEFLSPKDGKGNLLKNGCSDKDYSFRLYAYEKKLYKENDCPYMACRQWIDNLGFDNCAKIAAHVSCQDGGWNENKVAEILAENKGKVDVVRIRIDELKALRRLKNEVGGLIGKKK